MDLQKWLDKGVEIVIDFGPKLLVAILIWIIGSWLIKKLLKGIGYGMNKNNYDESLKKFLLNLISWVLKILLILAVLGTVGINTTSFAAIIAAAGLAIGLALQGSLANFAGGVLILIFKPFKIGDLIEAQGVIGVVKEIEIFTTKLTSPTNQLVIIPNGTLSNGNIVNYSAEGKLRIDHVFGIDYGSNIKQAKEVLLEMMMNNPKVLKDPAPAVTVSELADSSVNLAVRPWANVADYWDVYFETVEGAKEALDKAGIEIPYPHQVEIHKEG